MAFSNAITGGQGALIRPAIKSPNYVAGTTGWTINRDGTAEFAGITIHSSDGLGRTIVIKDGHIYVYDTDGVTLLAEVSPDISGGGGGFIAYSQGGSNNYVATLADGAFSVTSPDFPGLLPGFLAFDALGGGLYEMFLAPPHDPGCAAPQINMYSETTPSAEDSEISFVGNVLNVQTDDLQFNGTSLPRGVAGYTGIAANTGTVTTTETVAITTGSIAFQPGRAYRIVAKGLAQSSIAADRVQIRVRKGALGGFAYIDSMSGIVIPANLTNAAFALETIVKNAVGNPVVNTALVMTYVRQAGTGNARVAADANNSAYVEVQDIGPASAYATATAI